MQRISRQKRIEGTRVPGIIRNGHNYYVNLDIYEDGMINCWELVDLEGLKEKLRTNWILTQIPDGDGISIHGLGFYKIESGKWKYDKRSYFRYINSIIKNLNPNLRNIYRVTNEEKELLKKRKVFFSPTANEFYVKNEIGYRTVDGSGFSIFFNYENKYYLVTLVVYQDGKVVCYNSKFEISYTIEEIEELFGDGTFFTCFDDSRSIILDNFAEVTLVAVEGSTVRIKEKYKELIDGYQKLNKNETTIEKCRRAYFEYLQSPCDSARNQLKELYEAIPEHERIYLGDMDTRDSDYQRIIYNPEVKREV